uniref:Uncharacterized protein n=1 Tax=Arundo donax TaxID=35708 RepID=A0A0A9DXZ5_ARUDO
MAARAAPMKGPTQKIHCKTTIVGVSTLNCFGYEAEIIYPIIERKHCQIFPTNDRLSMQGWIIQVIVLVGSGCLLQ